MLLDNSHGELALAGSGRTNNYEERVANQWPLEDRDPLVNRGGILLLEIAKNKSENCRGYTPAKGARQRGVVIAVVVETAPPTGPRALVTLQ